jgi:ABC-type glycerol-3-phosphate transport system permease component
LITSTLAGYSFARIQFIGRDKIFWGYLSTFMIPGSVTMIPVFILVHELGWFDTYIALIIPAMFTAYGTFMLRKIFMSIPTDLEDATHAAIRNYSGISQSSYQNRLSRLLRHLLSWGIEAVSYGISWSLCN